MQIADVKKTLGSVSKMNDAGNTIIFNRGHSRITPDLDGKIMQAAINAAKILQN